MQDNTSTEVTIGRPTKFTNETIKIILDSIRLGSSYTLAAQAAGIAYNTFNEWMKAGAKADGSPFCDFYDKVRQTEGQRVNGWLQHIENAAANGAWTASAWRLERLYPDDFGKVERVNISHGPQLVTFQWQPSSTSSLTDSQDDATDVLEGNYTLLSDDNEEPED